MASNNDENNEISSSSINQTLQKLDPSILAPLLKTTNNKKRPHSTTITASEEEEETNSNVNEYKGWKVPSHNYTIPTIQLVSIEQFYKDYISQRRPVVIQQGERSSSSKKNTDEKDNQDLLSEFQNLYTKWQTNNQHLREKAGNDQVMVEVRESNHVYSTFGRGNEKPMSFAEFLDILEHNDKSSKASLHYLTTQDVEANEDGQPDLMAPFMKSLQDDFPLRPKLMGNLIPQNINLWMGGGGGGRESGTSDSDGDAASESKGSSSGLHHDYHDNLYIVLRGKKRFRLYSPNDAEKMYTRGTLVKVHPNGRINYKGDETTAYGADLQADAAAKAAKAKEDAELRLMKAEEGVKEGKLGAEEELAKAEEALEEAMDALLDVEMNDNDNDMNSDDDDDDDGDDLLFGNNKTSTNDNDDFNEDDFQDEEDYEEGEEMTCLTTSEGNANKRRLVDKTVKDPDNFSKIKTELLNDKDKADTLAQEFPKVLDAKAAFCEVNVGDILYLPASWFHEVTSFAVNDGGDGSHLAMNYWFHPPDAVDNFEHPYTTDFWPNDFNLRLEQNEKNTDS